MGSRMNDVLVHVDENLDEGALHRIEDSVRHEAGVVSVGHDPHNAHVLMVVYDSEATRASSLLQAFRERGLHAQLVGL